MSLKTLVIKDLKIVFSDKKALILLIAMPIILYTILSFALSGTFDDGQRELWDIHIGVVKTYDLNDASSAFLSDDEKQVLERILFDVLDDEQLSFLSYEIIPYEEGLIGIEENRLDSLVVLPENYVTNLALNMSPTFRSPIEVEVIQNMEKEYSSMIVTNIVEQVMSRMSHLMIANKVSFETLNYFLVEDDVISTFLDELNSQTYEPLTYTSSVRTIDKLKTVTSGQYYSTAMLSMFLLFGASYGAKFMLKEKREFTLQRQLVTGLSSNRLVIGKLILIFMIAIVQIVLMILTSTLGFGVYWGNPIHLSVVVFLTALAVMGFGTILSALSLKANNFKTVNMMESGIFQLLALFGGSYLPIFLMPDWFRFISRILLNGAALEAFQKVMMDAPLIDMMPACLSLVINFVVFFAIGLRIINKEKTQEVTA